MGGPETAFWKEGVSVGKARWRDVWEGRRVEFLVLGVSYGFGLACMAVFGFWVSGANGMSGAIPFYMLILYLFARYFGEHSKVVFGEPGWGVRFRRETGIPGVGGMIEGSVRWNTKLIYEPVVVVADEEGLDVYREGKRVRVLFDRDKVGVKRDVVKALGFAYCSSEVSFEVQGDTFTFRARDGGRLAELLCGKESFSVFVKQDGGVVMGGFEGEEGSEVLKG